ncbi:MAG: ABC transporter substrate-binding protein [Candidatus Contubernalis sp.]|nr:ABC transporter substrate-binding protein [Candidatus Contubernalis sp.]
MIIKGISIKCSFRSAFSFVVLCFVLFSLFFTSCSGEKNIVRVGTWKTPQTIHPWFYQQFLPDYQVKVMPFTNPGDQKAALLAGSLDFCGTTWVHAVASASRGEPVVAVASLCEKASALVVSKGAGITGVTDLRGKTIGYVPGTMHEMLLREVLVGVGLDPDTDVTLMRVDFFDMGTALSTGSIDAFLSGEPYPSIAVKEGYGEILSYPYYEDFIGTINAAWITSQEMIKKEPELIQKIVSANARAVEYLRENPDEWMNHSEQFGFDREVMEISFSNIMLTWDLDEETISRVKKLGQRMLEMGLIEKEPDWELFFDISFVERTREKID